VSGVRFERTPDTRDLRPETSATRRVALNTAAPTAARLIDAAFALVYLRLLGRTDVGAYQFLVVFTTYLDTLIDFGLNALLAREVPRNPAIARTALRRVSLLRLALWLVGLAVVLLVYGPGREAANLNNEAAIAGVVFYVALLPTVLAKTASGLLWGLERLDLTAAVSVLATLLKVGLGAVVLFGGLGLVALASTSLVVNVVTAAVLLILLAPRLPATGGAQAPAAAQAWLKEGWPLFLNQLLQGLFFKIDALLLPALAGLQAAGAYAAAYKVSEGAGILSSSFTLALFPRLAATNEPQGAYRMALRILLQLAFPVTAAIALLAEPIIAIVAGREYLPDSATALSILICYLPLSYANGLTQYLLIAAGRQRPLTLAFLFALAFNLAANFAFIPRYGYVGAAWVTVLSEVVLLVPFQLLARSIAPTVSLVGEARKPLLATLLMAPVLWWLRDVHVLLGIAAALAIYPTTLWALGGIDAQQARLLGQLMPAAYARRLRP
jgi:O-antigen/teichoic acid export membrane protein